MIIFLCRHGETTGDIEDRYGGDYEDELSKNGKSQVSGLAEKLKNQNIEVVFHSPKHRAIQTAQIVSKALNVKTIVAKDFRERNAYGVLTGLIKLDAQKKYPLEVQKLQMDKINHSVCCSENYSVFKARVLNEFSNTTSSKKYNTVCIITHGGPISCIVRELLNLGEIKKLSDCAILKINSSEDSLDLIESSGMELEQQLK